MTTYLCPKGHASETDDFCDTCGARIGGAAIGGTAVGGAGIGGTAEVSAVDTPPAPSGQLCPHCGTPRAGTARFCEDCGFDHTTGKVPVLTPAATTAPTAPTGGTASGWTATIEADRGYFEANAIEGADFPADTGRHVIDLPSPQARIGRRSSSKSTNPEIDLSDSDPGVSHNHALLTLSVDGSWLVSDLGSTNGTYLNDENQPLTAGESRTLKDGDQVHVGGWTTITLHAPG